MTTRWPGLILAAMLALTPPAAATWSIVLTDTATGEVAVGTATCLDGIAIQPLVPVILVGVGAGVTQSFVDGSGGSKIKMLAGLAAGTDPKDIIEFLKKGDLQKCSRQYGIADLQTRSFAFSGGCNGQWKGHLRGTVGTLTYSIQGNVITGEPVLLAARDAVLSTQGTMADKLMAGMVAAALMGGDGRCSCETGPPPSCGSPPVDGFSKSAHVGSMQVARVGDSNGSCSGGGCATGDYWMNLEFTGMEADPDPVIVLHELYQDFTRRLRGLPDALKSQVLVSPPVTLPGGQVAVDLELALSDLNGLPVKHGGASLAVSHAPGSAGQFRRSVVQDHGDGSYSIRVIAPAPAEGAPVDLVQLVVTQGDTVITLYPYPQVSYSGSR